MDSYLVLGNLAISVCTVGVAIAVAVITYEQHTTNRLRLRHELFERRFAIFKTTQVYLSEIAREGRLKDETFANQYPEFVDAWQRSRFLFDSEIPEYLDAIRKRSLEMRKFGKQRKHEEEDEHLGWLLEQTPTLFDKFGPYLCFPVK